MKILFTQLGRIGDMILLTPAFAAVRKKYPDARIDVLCSRHNYPIIKNNPRINRKIIFEKSPLKLIKSINKIRSEKYDYLVDPKDHYSTESRFIASIARAREKIGYNRPGKNVFSLTVSSDKENEGLHFTERALNVLKPLGIPAPDKIPAPELYPDELSDRYVLGYTQNLRYEKLITVNISASRPDKLWQDDKWAALLQMIDLSKYAVLVTSAPSERANAENICSRVKGITLFKSRSMTDVISLVKASDLVITPDTSIVHVASAFNKPMLCLFNYNTTFFSKFRPLGDHVIVVRPDTPVTINDIPVKKVSENLNAALKMAD